MYVCMYVCMCVFLYVCLSVIYAVYVCMYVCMYARMYVMSVCMSCPYNICMVCTDVPESIQSIVCVQVISLNVREHGQRNQSFDFPIPINGSIFGYGTANHGFGDVLFRTNGSIQWKWFWHFRPPC